MLDQQTPLARLSIGQQRRVAFAALILKSPELLILDEPTNHLDESALEWLESFLSNYRGAVLMISHDRDFLSNVVTGVFELASTLRYYSGNYEAYTAQKKRELEERLKLFYLQQQEMSELKQLLKRETFSAKKPKPPKDQNIMSYDRQGENFIRAKKTMLGQAKTKLKQLETDQIEHPLPKNYKGIHFSPQKLESSAALSIEELKVEVPGKILISSLTMSLSPGDRLILQGPNGSGKSSLLRVLSKQSSDGVSYSPQAHIGYLPQEPEFFDDSLTVVESLQRDFSLPEHKLRSELYQMGLISENNLFQKIKSLSLGQKRCLQLIRLMLSKVNVLLLDEPTNHFAPHIIDQLETALIQFPGLVIAATHDRRFARKVGTKMLRL